MYLPPPPPDRVPLAVGLQRMGSKQLWGYQAEIKFDDDIINMVSRGETGM